jgi:putative membrane protein
MCAMDDRRPHWVYGAGDEPDPRYSLANERTFLAWVRTALGMLAGGVALHALRVPDTAWLRTALAVALVVFGALTTVLALLRWGRVERAIRTGQPMPSFSLGVVLTVAVVVGALLVAMAFLA